MSLVILDLILSGVALAACLTFFRPGWDDLQASRLGILEPIDKG